MGWFKVSTTTRADRISNFQATTCDYGTPVLDIYGTTRVAPNVINWQDFYSQEIRTTTKQGKSKNTSINYRYYVYLELALGETITDVGKIWIGDKQYNSLQGANSSNLAEGFPLELKKDGGVSNYMQTKHPDKAVDYKHLAYLHSPWGGSTAGTFLGQDSAAVPSYQIEVKGSLLNTGDGIDANPADVILYLLKKLNIYNGVDDEETIVEGIGNYRLYCRENDLLISTPVDATSQKKTQEIIKDICDLTDIYFFWSNDRFKIAIKDNRSAGDWKPNTTVVYDLNEDDMLLQTDGACVSFARKDSSEIYNRFTLEWCNRDNSYENETISYELSEDISKTGLRQASTVNGKYFYKKERAIKVCEMLARRNERERNKYNILLDWAYCILEPGDLVTLSDKTIGLNKQIAMVNMVTENKDGTVSVELLQYFDGNYSAGIIDVGENDYNYIDYNIEPDSTADPIIFQPPSDATLTGNELWIALKGTGNNWGGCNILGANQDANYSSLGNFRMKSQYGVLTADMGIDADTFTANINGDFENVTLADAQNANSMFWIDGECLSYQTATKNSDGTWTFGGIIRGQFNTNINYHSTGANVVLCNGSLFNIELTKKDIGRKIFFKFPAVNVFNANQQDESDLDYCTYTIKEYGIPSASDIVAYSRYYQTEDAVSYSIQVEWTPPDLGTYSCGQVWYKQNDSEKWQYADSGINSATIPNAVVGDTYLIAVCIQDIYGVAEDPDTARKTTITVQTRSETPNMPEGVSIIFEKDIKVSWNFVSNADVRYYEVRLDNLPGVTNSNFLGRTTSNNMIIKPLVRTGTIYVFAYGVNKTYSLPGTIEFNLPKPITPTIPDVRAGAINNFFVKVPEIPAGCYGMNVYVNDEKFFSESNSYTYVGNAGIYSVSVSFIDALGEGDRSPEAMVTIKATIDGDLIEAGAISGEKLDSATQKALEDAKQTAEDLGILEGNVYTKTETDEQISSSFTNFENGTLKSYATITQMNDAISLAVKDIDIDGNEILTKINLADGTITLDGKFTHITGDTQIDGSVITNNMLAGSITGDKIMAGAITAEKLNINGGATTGARIEIQENLLLVYDENNVIRVKLGIF